MKDTTDTDHDLLIRIDERLIKLDTCFTNHLRHHFMVTMAMLTALLGLTMAFILMVI